MFLLKPTALALTLVLALSACQPQATAPQTTADEKSETAQTIDGTPSTKSETAQANAEPSNAFAEQINAYKAWAGGEVDSLLTESETLVKHLKAGDFTQAKSAYLTARVHFERIEPIAEQIGELDGFIDRREADLENGETWRGFHAIEKQLWSDKPNADELGKLGDQLLTDIQSLKEVVGQVALTADNLTEGAVDLLNEVATSKITGEEEIFSKSDLNVFVANVDGAKNIFELFKDKLDKGTQDEIQAQFDAVYAELAKHKTDKGYKNYDQLNKDEIRTLAESISKLGEPLAKLGQIFTEKDNAKS